MTEELTQKQIDAIEGLIKRRMDGTGETRSEASAFLVDYLKGRQTND